MEGPKEIYGVESIENIKYANNNRVPTTSAKKTMNFPDSITPPSMFSTNINTSKASNSA